MKVRAYRVASGLLLSVELKTNVMQIAIMQTPK